jgi:hypothetical protein
VRWTIFGVAVVLVAAGGFAYWWKFVRRDISPVDVQAVEREFGRQGGSRAVLPDHPAPGVYRYRTIGEEHVNALGGQTNHYPATTTLTVTNTRCGVDTRWDILTGRYEANQLCLEPDGDWLLVRTDAAHRFFNQTETTTGACTGMVELPADPKRGAQWSGRCGDNQSWARNTFRVLGTATVRIDGAPVETLHLEITTEQMGDRSGGGREERWVHPETGLIVRSRNHHRDHSPSPVGSVTYEETYEIMLESLTPRA